MICASSTTRVSATATSSTRAPLACAAWSRTLQTRGDTLLVIEQDDSLLDWDRRQIYALAREARLPLLRYEHRRASAEQLLAIPELDGPSRGGAPDYVVLLTPAWFRFLIGAVPPIL